MKCISKNVPQHIAHRRWAKKSRPVRRVRVPTSSNNKNTVVLFGYPIRDMLNQFVGFHAKSAPVSTQNIMNSP